MSYRKTIVFPKDVSERLIRLAKATRLESGSSVVRLSLIVLEDLVEEIRAGNTITFEDERSGQRRRYNPFLDAM
jgi:hypothetical protein